MKINIKTNAVVNGIYPLDSDLVENENISFPGYESIFLKANKKSQQVYLFNPEINTCYFKISIILEDGKVIYESDLLEPGNAFTKIVLNETLEKGEYKNTSLNYQSFSMKDNKKLNGSTIMIKLIVT